MPIHTSLLTVFVCNLCWQSLAHSSTAQSPLAEDFAKDRGWLITPNDLNPLDGTLAVIACPRCKPVISLLDHRPSPELGAIHHPMLRAAAAAILLTIAIAIFYSLTTH